MGRSAPPRSKLCLFYQLRCPYPFDEGCIAVENVLYIRNITSNIYFFPFIYSHVSLSKQFISTI